MTLGWMVAIGWTGGCSVNGMTWQHRHVSVAGGCMFVLGTKYEGSPRDMPVL